MLAYTALIAFPLNDGRLVTGHSHDMVKLDFFSFGSKKPSHPLDSVKLISEWYAPVSRETGTVAHDKATELLMQFNAQSENYSPESLEAVLALDRLLSVHHQQLCEQYLLNTRMPKALEAQLRAQILGYGRQILSAYQRFMSFDPDDSSAVAVRMMLPLVIARMMHYLTEFALWQYYRHFQPDEMFWRNVNQLFAYAEQHHIDAAPVQLFPDWPNTTIHDLYLSLLMVSMLTSGNLSIRQIRFAYQLILRTSNTMTLGQDYLGEASFLVNLTAGQPPSRVRDVLPKGVIRVWHTADLVDQLTLWATVFESGGVPGELKPIMTSGVDAGLLRYLCREWAVKPYRFDRAERVRVQSLQVEVAQRLPVLHKLVREVEEKARDETRRASGAEESFDVAEEVRIYGFVTSRRRERQAVSSVQVKEQFPFWDVDNKSETGLGLNLPAQGNEWVALGTLLGFRDRGTEDWSLGVVRRLQRPGQDRIYLGVQILTSRPVAAALRQEEGRPVDPTTPSEMVWNQGEIALFVPLIKEGKKLNTLLISTGSYAMGKQFHMVARGKMFQISLGRVVERATEWCQVEVELIKTLS